jgi:hypothetical protein
VVLIFDVVKKILRTQEGVVSRDEQLLKNSPHLEEGPLVVPSFVQRLRDLCEAHVVQVGVQAKEKAFTANPTGFVRKSLCLGGACIFHILLVLLVALERFKRS